MICEDLPSRPKFAVSLKYIHVSLLFVSLNFSCHSQQQYWISYQTGFSEPGFQRLSSVSSNHHLLFPVLWAEGLISRISIMSVEMLSAFVAFRVFSFHLSLFSQLSRAKVICHSFILLDLNLIRFIYCLIHGL